MLSTRNEDEGRRDKVDGGRKVGGKQRTGTNAGRQAGTKDRQTDRWIGGDRKTNEGACGGRLGKAVAAKAAAADALFLLQVWGGIRLVQIPKRVDSPGEAAAKERALDGEGCPLSATASPAGSAFTATSRDGSRSWGSSPRVRVDCLCLLLDCMSVPYLQEHERQAR